MTNANGDSTRIRSNLTTRDLCLISILRKLGSAIATLSPIMTPFPGARLYKFTATQYPFLSVIQKVKGTDCSEWTEQITFPKITLPSLLLFSTLLSPEELVHVSSKRSVKSICVYPFEPFPCFDAITEFTNGPKCLFGGEESVEEANGPRLLTSMLNFLFFNFPLQSMRF